MTNPTITIHNVETGEILEREMNAEELAKIETDAAKAQAEADAELTKAAEKAALLAKLGISEAEAKLLLS
jgi:hypothetical protein